MGHENVEDSKKVDLQFCLERGWELFAIGLNQLPIRRQLNLRMKIAKNAGIGIIEGAISPWNQLLNRAITKEQEYKSTIPGLKMTATDARVNIMTTHFRNIISEDLPLPVAIVFAALRSTLPWNVTGFNDIDPQSLKPEDARKARSWIEARLKDEHK
jgi:hypothetical protein